MLSLSPLTVLPCSPLDQIDAAHAAGFDAVGLRLIPVVPTDIDVMADRALQASIKLRLAETGMQVLDIEVVRVGPKTDVAALASVLRFAGEIGARHLAMTSPARSEYSTADEAATARKLAEVCEAAAEYGIKPMLEFMAFRGISTLEDAVRIVGQVGHPNLRICVDALHLLRSGGTPASLSSVDARLFACIQLCDAPAAPPEDLQSEARSGRLYPGDGALPLVDLLKALPAGLPISVEVPCVANKNLSTRERAAKAMLRTQEVLASVHRA